MQQRLHQNSDSEERWISRYAALGRAQSLYLYLLLSVVVFFLTIDHRARTIADAAKEPVGIPQLGLALPPQLILVVAPAIIYIVLLAMLGALRAARTAHEALEELWSRAPDESVDPVPNLIDLVVYDLERAPRIARSFGAALYPLVLTSALVVAIYLSITSYMRYEAWSGGRILTSIGTLLLVPVCWRLLKFWGTRVEGIRAPWLRKESSN